MVIIKSRSTSGFGSTVDSQILSSGVHALYKKIKQPIGKDKQVGHSSVLNKKLFNYKKFHHFSNSFNRSLKQAHSRAFKALTQI